MDDYSDFLLNSAESFSGNTVALLCHVAGNKDSFLTLIWSSICRNCWGMVCFHRSKALLSDPRIRTYSRCTSRTMLSLTGDSLLDRQSPLSRKPLVPYRTRRVLSLLIWKWFKTPEGIKKDETIYWQYFPLCLSKAYTLSWVWVVILELGPTPSCVLAFY